MPEFINDLPLHALVVHFVVVLIPLAVLGSVVIALWPAARARYGWLVVAVAAVAAALVPVASTSGQTLEHRKGESDLTNQHQELGDLMLYFAIALLIAVAALMVVYTIGQRQQISWARLATVVAAVVTIGLGVATGIHVYRVGEAGSRAVWGDVQNLPPR